VLGKQKPSVQKKIFRDRLKTTKIKTCLRMY